MNTWLLGASAALAAIGAVHSVMGARRIFVLGMRQGAGA
jgi:hypothetical protein